MDQLLDAASAQVLESLVRELQPDDLWRALGVAVQNLVSEVNQTDAQFAARIVAELAKLS